MKEISTQNYSVESQGLHTPHCPHDTVLDLIQIQTQTSPQALAVMSERGAYTYLELDQASNNVANHLVRSGLHQGEFVALFLDKSIETIVAILGVLKAGGVYVPIDTTYPANRIKHMLSDTKALHILTQHIHQNTLLQACDGESMVHFVDRLSSLAETPLQKTKPRKDDLAYLIYTSGTTGVPKGVLINHGTLASYIQKQSTILDITHEERILQFSNYSFDASVEQIFLSLTNGATLVIPSQDVLMDNDALATFIDAMQVTHIHATPSFLEFVPVRHYPSLRRIISAGERCDPKLAKAWSNQVNFINKYGPTESTISTHEYFYRSDDEQTTATVPIGKPLPGIIQRILTTEGKDADIGEVGELYVGGDQLSVGYLNLPELTERQFVQLDGLRMYRTGDLVKPLRNDVIGYIGRVDEQLKIRGYRVEPGEIEYHLSQLDGVQKAVIAVKNDQAGIHILVAYVVLDDAEHAKTGQSDLSKDRIGAWRRQLSQTLPSHMIPNAWVVLNRIPLTANNKVDRLALPAPQANQLTEAGLDIGAYTETQRGLAGIWAQILGVPNISLDDDFFELGGHSLLAMQALTKIRRSMDKPVPLSLLLRNPTLKDFSAAVDNIEKTGRLSVEHAIKDTTASSSSQGLESPIRVPMIAPQQEIWLSCQLGNKAANLAYNVSLTLTLKGNLNVVALSRAVEQLVERHSALRAFVDEENECLVILPSSDICLQTRAFSAEASSALKEREFEAFVNEQMHQEFDLGEPALFRIFLHSFTNVEHRLTIVAHHIICDGASMRVLVRDLASLYDACILGQKDDLSAAPQIATYADERIQFEHSSEYARTLDFWLKLHQHQDATLDLPTDYPRTAVRTYEAASLNHSLGTESFSRLKTLAANTGMSMAATLTAVMEVFLYHRTGQPDITLGLTSAGQYLGGYDDMVGHCVNLLPLRSHVNPDQPFSEYLADRKDGIYGAYEHQQLTFSELLRKLNIKRDRAQIPLIPFVLTIQAAEDPITGFSGLEVTSQSNASASQTFELFASIILDSKSKQIEVHWSYNKHLFARDTIARMGGELALLIGKISEEPRVPIGRSLHLPHPFPAFEQYTIEYPNETTLLDHFTARASQQPHATAVLCNGNSIAFGTLDRKSNQLAHYLRKKGVKPNDCVILCASPSIDMVIAFLGIWKAGATYVPIDPELPEERLKHIIRNTGTDTVILNQDTAHIAALATLPNALVIDQPGLPAWECDERQPLEKPRPGDGAYVIYTSGSTGNPKGVLIGHEALVDYYFGLLHHVPQLSECREYILGSPVFTDLGNTVLYGSLISGGRLHLLDKEQFNDPDHIGPYFSENEIDFLKIVPSHWNYFSKLGVDITPKKVLMLGGEGLPSSIVEDLRSKGKSCTVVNEYGPTETTIGKLLHIVEADRQYGSEIPIGTPYSNASIYVLNENHTHCPVGVPGELFIGGPGLAAGYLAESELTAKAFFNIALPDGKTKRLYKTGDIVRWLPSGEIEYLGRKDEQVKIRGNRIELAEIEKHVGKLAEVAQCAVLAVHDKNNEKQLTAYVVASADTAFEKEIAIAKLRKTLPEYMIPRHWVLLSQIPLNANGKTDKKALLQTSQPLETIGNEFVPPTTPTQQKLAEIWASCMGLEERIGIHDDFFDLGGYSLIAVRIMARIREHYGLKLPLATLFEHPTIEKLAHVIDGDADPLQWDCVIPIRTTGSRPPLFIVHGALLDVMYARLTLPYLDPDQPLYGIQGMGLSGKSKPAATIERIASHYVAQVLEQRPTGPYALVGYSSGGLIAFEMAKQLKQQSKHVYFLGLFDSFAPSGKSRGLAGITAFGKLVLKESFFQYGRKKTFLFLSLIVLDTLLKRTVAKISKTRYTQVFPADYWKSKAQLIYILAARKYRPTPLDVNTVLFKSPFTVPDMPNDPINQTNGWCAIIRNRLKVARISIPHSTMFNPEEVRESASQLANELTAALDQFLKSKSSLDI